MTKSESAHITAQTELLESAEQVLQLRSAAGIRLAIPDTNNLIMVGTADWIAANVPGVEAMAEGESDVLTDDEIEEAAVDYYRPMTDSIDDVIGFARSIERATIARLAATTQASTAQAELPAILFDGKAVYGEVMAGAKCRTRTSAENVADTLQMVLGVDPSAEPGKWNVLREHDKPDVARRLDVILINGVSLRNQMYGGIDWTQVAAWRHTDGTAVCKACNGTRCVYSLFGDPPSECDACSDQQPADDLPALLAGAARQAVRDAGGRPDKIKERLRAALANRAPLDMVLHCPACGLQHVDAPSDGWTNPPHRSHLCHGCGHIWRPADVPTNGAQAISTRGTNDSPIAAAIRALRSARGDGCEHCIGTYCLLGEKCSHCGHEAESQGVKRSAGDAGSGE